jgi:uncharacterized membrane protein
METLGAPARRNTEAAGAGLQKGLGWFSVGLGLAELAAPRALARAIGIDDGGRTGLTIRAFGARELANGLGILARPRAALPLWARVAGDALDLAFLAWAFGAKRTHTERLVGAIASVAGVAALDVIASRRAIRTQTGAGKPILRAITVYRPAADVYAFWRDFEQLPMFMSHLESVEEMGGRSRWTAKLPTGNTVQWEAEVIDDRPGERIEWRTVRGSKHPNRGRVTFRPILGGSATEVCVEMQVGEGVEAAIASLFAGAQIQGDLRRFKQVLETGEVVRSDASIHRGPHPAQPSEAALPAPSGRAARSPAGARAGRSIGTGDRIGIGSGFDPKDANKGGLP